MTSEQKVLKDNSFTTYNDKTSGLTILSSKSNSKTKLYNGHIYSNDKLVCWNYPQITNKNIDINKLSDDWKCTEMIDGTLLRLYNVEDKWRIATNRYIDANKASWGTTKRTFGEMFKDYFHRKFNDSVNHVNKFLEKLDPKYNYGFILSCPHTQKLELIKDSKLYQLFKYNIVDCEEMEELDDLGYDIINIKKKPAIKSELLEVYENSKDYGYIIISPEGKRYKYQTKYSIMKTKLFGNNYKIEMVLINNIKDGLTLIKQFPKLRKTYNTIIRKMNTHIDAIYKSYTENYKNNKPIGVIHKINVEPKYLPFLTLLHEKYLDGKKITVTYLKYLMYNEVPGYLLSSLIEYNY